MKHSHTIVLFCILIAYGTAIVGRSIINQQQFKVCKGLCKNTVHTVAQILFHFIYRHNNTYFWHRKFPLPHTIFFIPGIFVRIHETSSDKA